MNPKVLIAICLSLLITLCFALLLGLAYNWWASTQPREAFDAVFTGFVGLFTVAMLLAIVLVATPILAVVIYKRLTARD